MGASKATIADVAKRAAVSRTTVSLVLNNRAAHLREETRARVLSVIRELNYRPSAIARSLKTEKTRTIGLVIESIASPFYPAMAQGIEDECRKHGYGLILCCTADDLKKEIGYFQDLGDRHVDGIIWASSIARCDKNYPLEHIPDIPLVLLNRRLEGVVTDSVTINDVKGGFLATSYLIKSGHRRIAFFAGPLSRIASSDRLSGYRLALEQNGIEYRPDVVLESDAWNEEGGRELARLLLSLPERPAALFASNDLMAFGALQVFTEEGIAVPGDVAVVGFDNLDLGRYTRPTLTTVTRPYYEMGREAARMLVGKVTHARTKVAARELECDLIVRESSGGASRQET